MDRLKVTAFRVKRILEDNPKARNSDSFLYYLVCKEYLAEKGVDIDEISFSDGLLKRKELDIPKFETVRRARQKVQQHHPELAAHENIEAAHELNEGHYREFARGVV